ncbi:hypothetical protein QTP70_026507, partial [Hemibagrus guttatus]
KGRELADMMERRKVDILRVQETRWKGSKARSIGAGFKLFYYGVDSKRNGVGVVLKEEFVRNVLEMKRVSDRVMSLKLEIEGVMLNVVSGYAPQVGCELEEKERFWSELDEVMESIPTGERVVIGADFNGHVGEGNTVCGLCNQMSERAGSAEPRPHLGYSDHISVMLIPAYRPLVRCSKPVLKPVKTWPEGAISALQDSFECTDWNMFREAATNGDTTDLEEYTSSVTSYISKCIDEVTISKSITTRSNQKPWMTAKVHALLKSRDSAFRAGAKDALRTAWAKLSLAIREAKRTHSQRIHGHFQSSGDTRCMWQGIQSKLV